MAENTKIEWAHHTFNPWIGCTKVGPGCDNCYAEADFDKRRHVVTWGAGQPRKRTGAANWALPLRWNREAERLGVRYRVFCASLADVFDNDVPTDWRADLFDLIAETPHLDWLLLTKRIGNAERMMNLALADDGPPWPWENLWIGATITNQEEADRDIPKLLNTSAAVRFLSMEPLLGRVDISRYLHTGRCHSIGPEPNRFRCGLPAGHSGHHTALIETGAPWLGLGRGVDWVVVGGESGQKARPMHPSWARSVRDQCAAAGVPFLFKQWGEWVPAVVNVGGEMTIRVGKKTAGRLLDGRTHDGYPECGQ